MFTNRRYSYAVTIPMSLSALSLGYSLELLLGDPEGWPHPVRGVGWLIARGEMIFRRLVKPLRVSGACLVVALLVATVAPVFFAREALRAAAPAFVFVFDGIILYLSLSANQLLREGWSIYRCLDAGDLAAARKNLSRLVSRRTEDLEEDEIVKATVETLSENFSDGFFAPLFYFLIFGPAGAVAYKVINTLDSMIGYRTERYIEFGWAAARLDDAANWIPARLAGWLVVAASPLAGFRAYRVVRVMQRDRGKHESPNAGIGKAAVAGALGVQIGGPARYADGMRARPFIGDDLKPLERERIPEAVRLLLAACAVAVLVSVALSVTVYSNNNWSILSPALLLSPLMPRPMPPSSVGPQ
jgi:adenosylcobinamide-phosphate synthase